MKRVLKPVLAVAIIVALGAGVFLLRHQIFSSRKGSSKVAVILPLTGPQSAIGRGAFNSVKLAFDRARPRFESKGLQVELVAFDDAGKPETAVAAAQRATADPDVLMSISHFNSPCALATVKAFHEAKMPVIIPAAVNSRITEDGFREVVRTCNTDLGQAEYMSKFLVDVMGSRRIYALHDSSAFGKGLVTALESALAARGVALAGQDAFHVGDVEFSPVLARIEAAKPDIVVVGCMAAEGALLRKQMVERKLQTPFIGFSGIFYETFIRNSGPAAQGTRAIFPLPPLEELPGGQDYEAAYRAAGFSEPFESAGPFGYVAGQVAVQTLLLDGSLTRQAIVEELRRSTFDTAFGQIRFDDRGEMSLRMFCFYAVNEGRWRVTHRVSDDGRIVAVGS